MMDFIGFLKNFNFQTLGCRRKITQQISYRGVGGDGGAGGRTREACSGGLQGGHSSTEPLFNVKVQ
jgi:hypothetical protein